jgi:diguanylate cyclase (GGDEF)-like protein/PAS domain S-box-containing protein
MIPLRLLLIEDNPLDAELVLRELRNAGFQPSGPLVDSESAFLEQIDGEWDLIISDFHLPRFTALQALDHLKSRGLDVPFIMVSGAVGEDIAVEALQRGAADFLMKDRIGRLGEAVRAALERHQLQLERKAARAALRLSEERLRMATSVARIGAWDYNVAGDEIIISPIMAELLGFPFGTWRITGEQCAERVHPYDRAAYDASEERANNGGDSYDFEFRYLRQDGTLVWLQERGQTVERDDHGKALRRVGVTVDVTERREAADALRLSEERLRLALSAARMGTWDHFTERDLVYMSDELLILFGLPPGSSPLTISDCDKLMHPEEIEQYNQMVNQARHDNLPFQFEYRAQLPDGRTIWVEDHGRVVERNGDGSVRRIAGVTIDMTNRKEAEEAVRESEQRFRALIQYGADIVVIADSDGTIRYVSPSIERILGYLPEQVTGQSTFTFFHPEDLQDGINLITQALGHPRVTLTGAPRVRHQDGGWRYLEITFASHLDDPAIRGILANARDVTERVVLEEQLRHQALHDTLTSLPNRALALDRLSQALSRAARAQTQVAVIFLNLDHFKVVNDGLGHNAGDQVLVEVARRLRDAMRHDFTVSRFSGDEFVCIVEQIIGSDDAETTVDRLTKRLSEPIQIADRQVVITASAGISVSSDESIEPELLIKQADMAMQVAKRAGNRRPVTFNPSMNLPEWPLLDVVDDLRRALELDEVRLEFQPIVSLTTGRVCTLEALVRWQHPVRGLISPLDFVPIAEQTDLIFALGQWVLARACQEAVLWTGRLDQAQGPSVAVNLSTRDFDQTDLAGHIATILAETGLAPHRLLLEITERIAMSDEGESIATLAALKAIGVRLAVDDFGTGYSGLSSLKVSLLDTLKVDRMFVAGLGTDERDSAIVRAVIAMASALKLTTVAEGIETAEQNAALMALGCDQGQGYFLSRPLLPHQVLPLLMQDDPFRFRKNAAVPSLVTALPRRKA